MFYRYNERDSVIVAVLRDCFYLGAFISTQRNWERKRIQDGGIRVVVLSIF